ncbi:MAG: hypothetical protein PVI01_18600 [Gemmatimonadales bacterium]
MFAAVALCLGGAMTAVHSETPDWADGARDEVVQQLVAAHGEAQLARAQRGVDQVLEYWRDEDGSREDFAAFVNRHFAGDQETLDEMFTRYQWLLEQLDGHMNEITLAFRRQSDLDIGPILPFDEIFAAYDASAHVGDDFFANKIAFVVLLNFPLTTLEERIAKGDDWSRRQWAEVRLAQRFSRRVPAEVNQAIAEASAVADQYIAEYNIWMHHLLDADGNRLFPPKMRLLSHWNLRDEIKAQYANGNDGLPKQRMIERVMEHIVEQTIPDVVVDNPFVDWNPLSNEVSPAAVNDAGTEAPGDLAVSNDPEPDTRYQVLLGTFQASRLLDSYSPTAPTLIARRFDENREIPEKRVREMFDAVLSSPYLAQVGALIEARLGRPLEPFDIWYNGFSPRPAMTQQELDAMVRERYPTPEAYEKDIPNLLEGLGFARDRAQYLAANILVEPARGSGHAWGAQMRDEPSRLRTRVGKDGMDYKGFNIAVHEMGHNVEQTLSLNDIDYTLLEGVPNTAFTEALAFVFQNQDLDLLGVAEPDPKREAMAALDTYWGTCEIAAVALVDMAVWHWMYDNPDATPAQLKDATIDIARDIWNRYYAPVFKTKDVVLLGIYSHMIHSFLYLPDYPIGLMIALQIEERMREVGAIGPEFERVAIIGNVTPDEWMKEATGSPVGPDALLSATGRALDEVDIQGGSR